MNVGNSFCYAKCALIVHCLIVKYSYTVTKFHLTIIDNSRKSKVGD